MANKRRGVDLGLLLVRLALGGIFIAHGVTKIMGGIPEFAKHLGGLGIPEPQIMAYATIAAEILGGLMVALGILPRIGALALAVVMGVAIFKVHLANGFFLVIKATQTIEAGSWIPHGVEYCVALLAMSLAVFFAGGGAYALIVGKKPPE